MGGPTTRLVSLGAAAAVLVFSKTARADDPGAAVAGSSAKPVWLTDLSFSDKESYDDNVLVVSGQGMPEQSSWLNTASFKLGVDLAPVLADGNAVQSLAFAYQADRFFYAQAPAEDYTAHRFNELFRGKVGSFSYSLDNAFLYEDGSRLGATYALNQLTGPAANQDDKYRNFFSQAVPRERRNQIQDRYTAQVRYDTADFFFRPISTLTYYNLNTALFNTSAAPYKGYQDWPDRWDVNGGGDLGFKATPDLAFTLGYRDGYQHQDQFSPGINSDQHFSSNHYQRVLLGLEGKPAPWLNVKLAAGPDFRDYNPQTPISALRTTRYYGEALATAALPGNQSLTLNYKQWLFVSSTGLAPYYDTLCSIFYHWNATRQLGLDMGAKYMEANFKPGDDFEGSAPSLRDDTDCQGSIGINYALSPHLAASITYTYDKGLNDLGGLAAAYFPAYRDFEHAIVAMGLQFKF
ncbi:MAG: hypothetical protein ABSA05_08280 [Opitutaceae bacterium]|jgi:hypothetical protein